MKIVITCSLPSEFNEARNQLGLKEKTLKKDCPRIAQLGDLTLVFTGIGKTNSVLNLLPYLMNFTPELIIDSGTCGSLKDEINPYDIVISSKSIEYYGVDNQGETIISENNFSIAKTDNIVASLEQSVTDPDIVKKLQLSGASIVTWETSSIFKIGKKLSVPVVSIRGVTDNCNQDTFADFKKNRVEVCKKLYNSIKTVCIGI